MVAHFAELGPQARIYLLRMKTMNRLLRIVIQSQLLPSDVEYMQDLVPLYHTAFSKNEGLYLMPNMLQGVHSKVLSNERQLQAQTAQSPQVFLIKTISALVRSCQFVNTGNN